MGFFSELGYFLERNVTDNYLIAKYEHQAKKEKAEESRIENLYNCAKKLMKSTGFTVEEALEAMEVSDEDKETLLLQLSDTD